jgi:hypothetical protein
MDSNIVACTEEKFLHHSTPKTLRELGTERALNRKILSWMDHDGTYGMGGPGFFSLELEKKDKFPKEKLTLCLWGACEWILLDGRWMESHPNQYAKQKPLMGRDDDGSQWDEITARLKGHQIVSLVAEGRKFEMRLSNGSVLSFPDDPDSLPLFGGSLQPHVWCDSDDWRDAWVYATGLLWTK